MATTNQ